MTGHPNMATCLSRLLPFLAPLFMHHGPQVTTVFPHICRCLFSPAIQRGACL